MQTSVMNGNQAIGGVSQNTNNMAGQDQGSYGRAMEPIFPPVGVEQAQVVARHEGMLNQVLAGGPVAVSPRVRAYDKVGDLTNAGRQKMPAMMRGADGKHLALTRRQLSVIKRYEESVPPPPLPPPETPRDTMLKLIAHLRDNEGAAGFHGAVPAGPGKTVQTLFATPPDLLDFLVTGKTQLGSVGVPAGQPLVVKGNPAASAFVAIVKGTSFMATKFQTPIATLGNRTGVEIVVAWISSLT